MGSRNDSRFWASNLAALTTERPEDNFQTATQYHMYCALALLAVGVLAETGRGSTALQVAGWSLLAGLAGLLRKPLRPRRDGSEMAGSHHADRRSRHAHRLAGAGRGGGIEYEAVACLIHRRLRESKLCTIV